MSKTKNILISGGSGGIGRAIARRVIEDGYHVINLDQVPPKTLFANEIFYQVDLNDAQVTQALIQELLKNTSILRLVNNAGIIRPGALEEVSLDDFDAVINLNLRAPMLLAQSLIPAMRSAKFGRIINIASRAALGKEERTAYAASKAGLLGMTRTWALEMASFGITVNAIGPGPIATELFISGNHPDHPRTKKIVANIPVQRMGEPEDVAHAVALFLDDRAGFITGQVLYVCGGITVGLSNVA